MPNEKKPARPRVVRIDDARRAIALGALQANRGNKRETERQTGVSRRTIGRIEKDPPDERLIKEAKKKIAEHAAVIAIKTGKLLATDEILAAIAAGPNPERLSLVYGVAVDKLDALTSGAGAVGAGTAFEQLLMELRRLRTRAG